MTLSSHCEAQLHMVKLGLARAGLGPVGARVPAGLGLESLSHGPPRAVGDLQGAVLPVGVEEKKTSKHAFSILSRVRSAKQTPLPSTSADGLIITLYLLTAIKNEMKIWELEGKRPEKTS